MKKLLALMLTLVLGVCGLSVFTACGKIEPIPETEGYTLKIGYTKYEPMNYFDENNKFVGHDTEFAQKVCADLGYNPKFIEIDWNSKETSLNAGEIDLIWNGMTITDELKEKILISDPYLENQQVNVVKKDSANKFKSVEDLAKASSIAYEKGSAADTLISENEAIKDVTKVECSAQRDAFLEVFANTSEVAVVDVTMAKAMTSPGTDYSASLTYTDIGFEKEEYGIGMRKIDTRLCEKINNLIAQYKEDGTLEALYDKYIA